MAGDEGDGAGPAAVGQRQAGVGRRPQRRRHAGNDLVIDAGLGQRFRLFAAAAEHERVAALEADHAPAGAGRLDHLQMDAGDALGMAAGQLIDADQLRLFRRVFQQTGGHETVVQNQIGLGQALDGAEGEQTGVARPGADQGDGRRWVHGDPLFAVGEVHSS